MRIFLTNPKISLGCQEVINLLKKNPFIRDKIEVINIESKYDLKAYKLQGLPAANRSGDPRPIYGGNLINTINQFINKNRPTSHGNIGGDGFGVNIGDDDSVSFDPSKIRDQSDFIIPDAPISRGQDVDTMLAREQAERETFDSDFNSRSQY